MNSVCVCVWHEEMFTLTQAHTQMVFANFAFCVACDTAIQHIHTRTPTHMQHTRNTHTHRSRRRTKRRRARRAREQQARKQEGVDARGAQMGVRRRMTRVQRRERAVGRRALRRERAAAKRMQVRVCVF